MKLLVAICRFKVEICNKLTVIPFHSYAKKIYFLPRALRYKVKVRVEAF